MLFAAFTTDGFLTVDNLTAILTITAFTGIIAVGSTLITLGGSFFSVSTGTTTAVTSILFVSTLRYGVVAAIVVTLLAGTLMSRSRCSHRDHRC